MPALRRALIRRRTFGSFKRLLNNPAGHEPAGIVSIAAGHPRTRNAPENVA